jgi:hypothetical protein
MPVVAKMIPVGIVKRMARARPKKTVPTLVLVGHPATEAIPKATPTIYIVLVNVTMFRQRTYVEYEVPPLWNLGVLLHQLCVYILELVDLAILLEALPERHETKFNVVPVIQSCIRDNGAIHGEEVDTIRVSDMQITS